MSRRLRLALLLVALAAAGPQVALSQTCAEVRANVTHAWVRSDRPGRPQILHVRSTPRAAAAPVALTAHRDPFFPETPHPHSLFQRPPPLSV